jgi:uncharacterized membrane protein HdeD (DUF308 family)
MSDLPDLDRLQHAMADIIHGHWKLFLVEGLVMMVLGLTAIAVPEIASLAITIFIGWLFSIAGVFRTVTLLRSRQRPGFAWSLATALLAVALGLVLLFRPLTGVLTLTMALGAFFVLEGVLAIRVALEFRRHLRSWGWVLVNGLVDLLLAYLIWAGWPGSAGWAIGLLVGINMVFFGLATVMTALAARAMGRR